MQFPQGEPQMGDVLPASSSRPSKTAWAAVTIASLLFLFLIENLWIDARLRHRSHRIPSFIPSAQSAAWFAIFVFGAIAIVLLLVCLVLLWRDHNTPLWLKAGLGAFAVLVMLLSVEWVGVTNGQPGVLELLLPRKTHKIVLTWQASPSPVVGYNVYRKAANGVSYTKLNSSPLNQLTYIDDKVQNGMTYFYVARAVGSRGEESANSNVFTISVP
jgi:hypothetical protein